MKFENKLSDEKYRYQRESVRTSKQYLLNQIPETSPLKILDIGCGTGLNSDYMTAMGHHVTGCDISLVALYTYWKNHTKAFQCDLNTGIPLAPDTVDLVFASEVIEHLYDPGSFLSEAHRILAPGGRLLLSTPNSAFWVYRFLGLFGQTVSDLQHPGHIRFFSKNSLLRLLVAAGFDEVNISGRHMYFIVKDMDGRPLRYILEKMGFVREYRFRTDSWFWHLSRFRSRAGSFWSDTLIVKALKA